MLAIRDLVRVVVSDRAMLQPACPSCGETLRLTRVTSRPDGRADLATYGCRQCGVWVTEAADELIGHHGRIADSFVIEAGYLTV
jgi:predicted RNA-binding Zn-ribbon protein involved in translation (DUF1610 family)